eukprot:TRINITY_DN42794_c0_g1_i1.p1 TRINITY_DN42794_c0_g1~~TRINITY_DN42794_c0_g1_i1.p1  ORF type:complete len:103 (+),score=20.82 TRINITY_DN42794_c0_g1_i1:57-365(+)
MLYAAGSWLGRMLMGQCVYHPDAFLVGFMASVLVLCCVWGPNGIVRNSIEVSAQWVILAGVLIVASYADRVYRRQQRLRRQASIEKSEETGSVLGGGGPALD